jgi:hypothetical protein
MDWPDLALWPILRTAVPDKAWCDDVCSLSLLRVVGDRPLGTNEPLAPYARPSERGAVAKLPDAREVQIRARHGVCRVRHPM